MNYPVTRTPEEGHLPRCLAKAIIAAVENYRDMCLDGQHPEVARVEFRIAMQDNMALQWADEYLAEGTTECICGESQDPEKRAA